jgi:hypothetical protein
MEHTFLFLLWTIIVFNIALSVYESLRPSSWISFLQKYFLRDRIMRGYAVLLALMFFLLLYVLLQTEIIRRFELLAWGVSAYLLVSCALYLFLPRMLQETFLSFLKESSAEQQKRLVHTDSFIRMIAFLMLAASLLR